MGDLSQEYAVIAIQLSCLAIKRKHPHSSVQGRNADAEE
jgi:hypothetical protein